MPRELAEDGPRVLPRELGVSHETLARLVRYVELVRQWQPAQNLVAPQALNELWSRHVADSLQLVTRFPDARRWLDLGSGAGFPGMVVAAAMADVGGTVDLVESNQRKCAFLRTVARATHAPAAVHCGRIESVLEQWRKPAEIVTARALASLDRLCAMAAPVLDQGARAVFHKGQDLDREVEEAAKSWKFDMVKYPSLIAEGSWLVEIANLSRR